MSQQNTVLYYFHDPMCSWCWGFKPVLAQLTQGLSNTLQIEHVVGGLAADSDMPMPEKMQTQIKSNWQAIQQTIPGTEFNYDFWDSCMPRRSTYPACRAVLASKQLMPDKHSEMNSAIQQAYYLQARNPSDYSVLYSLAEDIGHNRAQL